jgi:cytosine/adenosine deaminase-related metal-dependent hydrolase
MDVRDELDGNGEAESVEYAAIRKDVVGPVVETAKFWTPGELELQEDETVVSLRRMEKEGHVLLEDGKVYTPHTLYTTGRDEYERAREVKKQIKEARSPSLERAG